MAFTMDDSSSQIVRELHEEHDVGRIRMAHAGTHLRAGHARTA